MYNNFQLGIKYLKYYLTAANGKGHGMHSPFVFEFILDVLNNRQGFVAPGKIEQLRKQLLQDDRKLLIEDFGAGSRTNSTKERTVAQLARTAVKPKKYSDVLFRCVRKYQPANLVELGTSLGLTTAYLAEANQGANLITIEGSSAIQSIAKENFSKLGLSNVNSLPGNFDVVFPEVLRNFESVDLVYVDGNHRYTPTISYFNKSLEKAHNDTILIFDDIHWSAEMEKAWNEIKAHPAVRCTVDIFFLGFVFFRDEFKVKQDFVVRY